MNSAADIYLHDPVHALGSLVQTLEESGARGQLVSPPRELRAAGFAQHRVCAADETAYDLAKKTVAQLADETRAVDAIIYATCLPDNANTGSRDAFANSGDVKHLMHFPASQLQAEMGLSGAITFGLNQQACTGMLGSVRLARALLTTEPQLHRVLCLTADRFPQGAHYEQAYNLISDGAAAWLVSRQPRGFRILAAHQITNGALAAASDDESVGSFFNHTCALLQEAAALAGMAVSDLNWIVPQNMNLSAWRIMSRLLGIAETRIVQDSCAQVGHVISGDNVINLQALEKSGRLRSGDTLALVMAGFGMHWQCLIIERV